MGNITTYNNILTVLEDVATRHFQIDSFGVGDSWEIGISEANIHPTLWVKPVNAFMKKGAYGYASFEVAMNLTIFDLVDKDEKNEADVHSDTLQMLQDVVTEFTKHPFYTRSKFDMVGDLTFNPFTEKYDEEVTGWDVDILIRTPNQRTFCGIPVDQIPNFSFPTPTFSGGSIFTSVVTSIVGISPISVSNIGNAYTISFSGDVLDNYTTGSTLNASTGIASFGTIEGGGDAYTLDLNQLVTTGTTGDTRLIPLVYSPVLTATSSIIPAIGDNTSNSSFSSILGGANNDILDSNIGVIAGGASNIISTSFGGFIGTGAGNSILSGIFSFLGGGNGNIINNTANAFLGGGLNNTIDGSNNSFIGNGLDNIIQGSSNFSLIGTGENNIISGSTHSSIFAGQNNIIDSLDNTHILGSDITATTSATTYVNNFNINNTPNSATGSDVLVRESDGEITTRNLYDEFIVLSYGVTTTWNTNSSINATLTLTGATSTLAITNVVNGMVGVIKIIQDATGSRLLTLPANSLVINGGSGTITLTTTANAVDVLSFIYDGTDFLWTYGINYN